MFRPLIQEHSQQTVGKESKNAKKNVKQKYTALKLSEFQKQFMTGTFLRKLTPIWKNWIIKKNFISAGKSTN